MKESTLPNSTISNPDSVMSVEMTAQIKNQIDSMALAPKLRPSLGPQRRTKLNRITAARLAMEHHGFITNTHQHIIANCFTEFRMKQLSRKQHSRKFK